MESAFGFEITATKKRPFALKFEIDLKNGKGVTKKRKPATRDATLKIKIDDFKAVCIDKLNPKIAYMQEKMKIKGKKA